MASLPVEDGLQSGHARLGMPLCFLGEPCSPSLRGVQSGWASQNRPFLSLTQLHRASTGQPGLVVKMRGTAQRRAQTEAGCILRGHRGPQPEELLGDRQERSRVPSPSLCFLPSDPPRQCRNPSPKQGGGQWCLQWVPSAPGPQSSHLRSGQVTLLRAERDAV